MDDVVARAAVMSAWNEYRDGRDIIAIEETSAHVSTNRVYRLRLSDDSTVMAKVSNYGSYFLFAEDHDRLAEVSLHLQGSRWSNFLARTLPRFDRPYRWYDGTCWVVLYEDVPRGSSLPKTLGESDIICLAREIAEFHVACGRIAAQLPASSHSMKSDMVSLMDVKLTSIETGHEIDPVDGDVVLRSTHELLLELDRCDIDHWSKIPVLVDWNLGNFSIERHENGAFRLFSRWDYDWFRIDSRMLDFYFLSRVASATGDRTAFTYSPHTLIEDGFITFVRSYHDVAPLSREEVEFLPMAYRFFILNYVIREGHRFFRTDLASTFRREAISTYLSSSQHLDVSPLLAALN